MTCWGCFTILGKNIFLVSSLNLPSCCLCLLLLVISLVYTVISVTPLRGDAGCCQVVPWSPLHQTNQLLLPPPFSAGCTLQAPVNLGFIYDGGGSFSWWLVVLTPPTKRLKSSVSHDKPLQLIGESHKCHESQVSVNLTRSHILIPTAL